MIAQVENTSETAKRGKRLLTLLCASSFEGRAAFGKRLSKVGSSNPLGTAPPASAYRKEKQESSQYFHFFVDRGCRKLVLEDMHRQRKAGNQDIARNSFSDDAGKKA